MFPKSYPTKIPKGCMPDVVAKSVTNIVVTVLILFHKANSSNRGSLCNLDWPDTSGNSFLGQWIPGISIFIQESFSLYIYMLYTKWIFICKFQCTGHYLF